MPQSQNTFDRLPLRSKRYFLTSEEGCRSLLTLALVRAHTGNPPALVIFPNAGSAREAARIKKLARKLTSGIDGPIVEIKEDPRARDGGRRVSTASRLLMEIRDAKKALAANGKGTMDSDSGQQEKLVQAYIRLERQCKFALTSLEDHDASTSTDVESWYRLLQVFMDAMTHPGCSPAQLRLLLIPQEYRAVASTAAKLLIAAGQIFPARIESEHRDLVLGVMTFPSLEKGFEFSTIHLAASNEELLPPWDPYDQLPYFLAKVRPSFERDQQRALRFLQKVIKEMDLKFDHAFDIGCGDGRLLEHLSKRPNCVCIGIDPSPSQIQKAKARKAPPCVHFENSRFPKITTFSPKRLAEEFSELTEIFKKRGLAQPDARKCVFIVGNSLPHVGARALKAWLHFLTQKHRLPKYIVFDFLSDWVAALHGASGGVHLGATSQGRTYLPDVKAQLVTHLSPPNIVRGVIFTSQVVQRASNQPLVDYCMIEQHDDPPEVYKELLQSCGYDISEPKPYVSGWGKHELYVATLSDSPRHRTFPLPPNDESRNTNQAWHNFLTKLWKSACGSGVRHGSCLKNILFFPVGILAFERGRVWARYLETGEDGSGEPAADIQKKLVKIWLWVFDPSRVGKGRMSAAKPESEPPYAPGVYSALLAEVPTSVVQYVVDVNPPYDLNSCDLDVSDLERSLVEHTLRDLHLKSEDYSKYAIPIYYMGFPLFCVIAAVPKGSWTPSLLHQLLETEKAIIEDRINSVWSKDAYRSFVMAALGATHGDPRKVAQLPRTVQEQGDWNSWLETFPGLKILDDEITNKKFQRFSEAHVNLVRELTKEPFIQISTRLREKAFFTSTKSKEPTACGHEQFTERHQRVTPALKQEINKLREELKNWLHREDQASVEPDNLAREGIFRHCEEFLDAFSDHRGHLPEDDGKEPPSTPAYTEINWKFQCFKALFCRSAQNTENEYRVSPLMVYASSRLYLKGLPDEKIRLNGQPVDRRFNPDIHVKPKIGLEETWLKLIQLWKCITEAYVNEVDIQSRSEKGVDEIAIVVRFTKPIQTINKGASVTDLAESLANLGMPPKENMPAAIAGFQAAFRFQNSKASVTWNYLKEGTSAPAPAAAG